VSTPRQGARKPGETVAAMGKMLASLLIAAVMLIAHPILKSRDRWRYSRAASRLGFDLGQVIRRVVDPPLVQRGMTIVSLRPGDWQDAVESIHAAARAAGYQEPLESPGDVPPRDLWFWPSPGITGLPSFTLSAYAPGESMSPPSVTVPPGHTGLRIRLT
jgi:hypothetical protein